MGKSLYEKIKKFFSVGTNHFVRKESADPLNRKYFKYLRNRAIFWCIVLLIFLIGLFIFYLKKGLEKKEIFVVVVFSIILYIVIMMVHIYVLALLYVIEDSRRRNMSPIIWFLICLLVPYLLGFVIYLLVRNPLPLNCPKCNGPVPVNSKYCPYCGYSITKVCPKCGTPVPERANFCPHCGNPLKDQSFR